MPGSADIIIQEKPTAGIILAAGASTRFGQPKQLLRLKNKYLIEWVLDAALSSRLSRIILVLGDAHQEIRRALGPKSQHTKLQIEVNQHYKKGQSHSLQIGLSAVKKDYPAAMFLLADQPMVDTATIDVLLQSFWSANKDICVPMFQGKRGNPCIFSQKFYRQIMELKGDTGARQLIDANPDRVLSVKIRQPLCFFDIDTEEDFEKLLRELQRLEGSDLI